MRRLLSPSPQPSPLKGEGVSDQKFLLQCSSGTRAKLNRGELEKIEINLPSDLDE